MRKIIIPIVFLAAILLTNSAEAQTFKAGITLGATATGIDGMGTRTGNHKINKLGYVLGGIINFPINKKNAFQMEINYIKKGSLQKPDSMNMFSYKLALDYVEVPCMIRHRMHFHIGKRQIDQFDLEVGASVGRMVRHTWMQDGQTAPLDLTSLNKTDVSLLIGINYNFSNSGSLSFRYSNSIIPAVKHDAYPNYFFIYSFNTGNNMVFQMSVKFIFGKNKTTTE